jgi:hypothetical protein
MEETNSDEITVQEVQDLVKRVEDFYRERENPKINLIWLADTILKRLYNDLDYYVNIEGKKGFGKSNAILLLAILQCRFCGLWKNKKTGKIVNVLPRSKPLPEPWEHIKFGFQFDRNMSFLDNTEVVKKKFYGLDRYHPFIIDEGSKNLHKYQWANKLQFLLVKMSDTERYQNKAFYVCFPNFRELNSTFRNDRIEMRIFLYNKNVHKHFSSAIINIKDVNRHVFDPWHTEDNAKDFEYLLRRVPAATRGASHILYAESKLKGYAGYFDVPELAFISPKIWATYMKYKIANAQKDSADSEDDEKLDSKRIKKLKEGTYSLISFIKARLPDINNVEISKILDVTPMTISKLLNNSELKLKDAEIKEIINKLKS